MVVQRTHKLVVMGCINFEDHELIKRQWVDEKMNVMGRMLKDKIKQGNRQKQFVFVTKSCLHFRSFEVHNSMNAKSAIEKLQQIAREKEM
jgi:hypothetical protein